MNRKLSGSDLLCLGICAAGTAGMMLLPASGPLALLCELSFAVVLLGAGIWLGKLAFLLLRARDRKLILPIAAAALVILCLSGWSTGCAALDITQGSQPVTLYRCTVEYRSTFRGIFSAQRYLTGVDSSGQKRRYRISSRDASALAGANTVNAQCYAHTKRIAGFIIAD